MNSPLLRKVLQTCGQLHHLPFFEKNEITDALLPSLNDADLKEIGIEKLGSRKTILSAIRMALGPSTDEKPAASPKAHPAQITPDSAEASSLVSPNKESSTTAIRPKLFLSYGRGDSVDIAKRIESDLEAAGYDVWQDLKKIAPGFLWEREIENGLREAQVVVSLLSPQSVRRVDGAQTVDSTCLDELAFARNQRPPIPVVPVMVASCEPPLFISRLHYIDLTGWHKSEEEYRRGFDQLAAGIHEALAGRVRYRAWENRLRPHDFSDYLAAKLRGFVGREWLFEEIELWRFESEERALLITGDPGAGKSSIVAQLVHTNPGGQVLGYHCCQANEISTLSPAKFVQSLAAMIASQLPGFADQFGDPSVTEALNDTSCESDPCGAFLKGILQPLHRLPAPSEGVRYILVDALDEALCHTGHTNIVDVLVGRIERLPSWLRVIATTRNEPAVRQRLSGLRAVNIDASEKRNLGDLGLFIRRRLDEPVLAERLVGSRVLPAHAVEQIFAKSSGNFLYAVNALDGIARDFYSFTSLEFLPRGLDGLYADFFRRIFGRGDDDGADWSRAKPFLQVLCAAEEPLSRTELAAASELGLDEELPDLLRRLAQVLSHRTRENGEETVTLYHKSMADWLNSKGDENAFYIAPRKGRELLTRFCRQALSVSRSSPCWYTRRHAVRHFLDEADWDNAVGALSDLEFIEARAIAQELAAMLRDYTEAVNRLPEGEDERRREAARQAELDRYALALKDYADAWFRIRNRSREPKPHFPEPVKSVRLRSDEEISEERRRMTENPNRLDLISAFRLFVSTNATALQAYSARSGFVAHLARNDAPAGPVHEEGDRRLKLMQCAKLLRRFADGEFYNPLKTCRMILEGHTAEIKCTSLSLDGRFIVSGSSDHTLRVWDLSSGCCLRVLRGHSAPVNCVSVQFDGRLIVSGSEDHTLRVWDLSSGCCFRVLKGHSAPVNCLGVLFNGRLIVSGSEDHTLRVWDLSSGCCLRVLEGHTARVDHLVVSFDGHLVASESEDRTLRVWDLSLGHCTQVLDGYSLAKNAASLNSGRKVVFLLRRGLGLCVWDLESGGRIAVLGGQTDGFCSCLHLGLDGRTAILGRSDHINRDHPLHVWDLESGQCLHVMDGHTDSTFWLDLSADGGRAVSGSSDHTLRVWDLKSGGCMNVLGHHFGVNGLCISADGRHAVSSNGSDLRLWDMDVGSTEDFLSVWADSVDQLKFSPAGRRVVSGHCFDKLRVWDLDSGRCIRVLEGCSGRPCISSGFCVSLDGGIVVSGSEDHALRIWDADSGRCLKTLVGHTEQVDWISLCPNERFVVSGSDDETVRVWSLQSASCLNVFQIPKSVDCLQLSPDGRRVISGCGDYKLRVWNLNSGQCLHVLEGHQSSIRCLHVSPNGRHAVSGSGDGKLPVWDLDSGRCINILESFAFTQDQICFSPSGQLLVAQCDDLSLRAWDLDSGRCMSVFKGQTGEVSCLRISPDGNYVFSLEGYETVRIWSLDSGQCSGIFFLRGLFTFCFDWIRRRMIAGFSNGTVQFFVLENLDFGPFVTTVSQESLSEDLPPGPSFARPPCCGQRIPIPADAVERIELWSNSGGNGGYSDPDLLIDCPACGTLLRLNPFLLSISAS